MVYRLLTVAGEMTLREWVMLMLMATVTILMVWRTCSNVKELLHINRLGMRRGSYYSGRFWGTRLLPLYMLLVIETVVVLVLGVLTVVTLREGTFY